MISTADMSLPDGEHLVEVRHPGWHVWHTRSGIFWATTTMSNYGGSGTTLDAPSLERMDEAIGQFEWARDRMAGAA